MLLELAFGEPGGEVRTVDRKVESLEDIWQRAQMIFVPVGEDYRGDVVAVLFEEVEVGNVNIDAVGRLFRQTHAGIKDDHVIPVTHRHAIHPKLADTAERDDLQNITHFFLLSNSSEAAQWPMVTIENAWDESRHVSIAQGDSKTWDR